MRYLFKSFIILLAAVSFACAQQEEAPKVPTAPKTSAPKPSQDDIMIVIGTGPVTGIYYPAGGAICRLMNKERKSYGIRCSVESTPGSIYNINSLRNAEADLAIVQSDWQEHAFNGTGEFTKPGRFDKIRHMFSLHNEAFTVIVQKKSDVYKFDDIKGKIVNIGPKGSGANATMQELMKAKGWASTDFKSLSELKPEEQARALCTGKVDVMLISSGHPNGAVQEVASMCETRLVEVSGDQIAQFVQSNPEFSMTVIPGGTYNGSPDDVSTFGVKATLVTTTDVSEQMAYRITKSVFDNLEAFKALNPVFAQLTAEKMITEGRTAPLHPGAEKYYREKGLIK